MKKIYLVIAGAFLILLVITYNASFSRKKSTTDTQNNSPFPTGLPDRGGSNGTGAQQSQDYQDLDNLSNSFESIRNTRF